MGKCSGMRFHVFLTGVAVLASGGAAMRLLSKNEVLGYLNGALTLGGGLVICGLFSLKSYWHGLIGAGVLALLGAARGGANLPAAFRYFSGDASRGVAPLLELGVTLVCLVLLVRVLRALQQERIRRMLAEE
jgi:hypothetical protein